MIRLWGAHGQARLETANICVLGSGPTASETLKNLVLPSVGNITIVDNARVTAGDTGNNFFVTTDHIGKSRAATVLELLVEMNPDSCGKVVEDSASRLIDENIEFFDSFSLIIATGVPDTQLLKLADRLYKANVPLIVNKAYGLLGSVRLVVREHCIVESHPDSDRYDLFIHPEQLPEFPELKNYIDTFEPDTCPVDEHVHIPYIVILVKELEKYTTAHMGELPANYTAQKAFKKQVADAKRHAEAENYEEAVRFANRVYKKPALDSLVQAVYDDASATSITADSSSFWIIVNAMGQFIKQNKRLPVSESIPDMTSNTEQYVALKKIFKAKALEDRAQISALVQAAVAEYKCKEVPSEEEVAYLVRNCRALRVIRTRSLAEEYTPSSFNAELMNEVVADTLEEAQWKAPATDDEKPAHPTIYNYEWYFLLRAAEMFRTKHGRYPGSILTQGVADAGFQADVQELHDTCRQLISDSKVTALEKEGKELEDFRQAAQEVARYAGTEIHNIAAFMGGTAAQIALKVILKQFCPLNNTLLFNGIFGNADTYNL